MPPAYTISRHQRFNQLSAEQPSNTSKMPRLASSQWANDDATWMITLCDLTFLILGFLVLWYVSDKKQTLAQTKMPVPVAEERKTLPAIRNMPLSLTPGEWNATREEIENYVKELDLESEIQVHFSRNELLLSLKDTVPFASGRADLQPRALPLLEKLAAIVIRQTSLNIDVRGHTDDRPISTTEFPSNWELSAARASRVARYLIEKGVHPTRIAVQGYANQRPRVSNVNAVSRSANRRVEIRLYQSTDFARLNR